MAELGPQGAWLTWGGPALSAFLASAVECAEALTVILAIGGVRGYRAALLGVSAALALLLAMVAGFGAALVRLPRPLLQVAIGALLLLFGLRWLRKAVLRIAGRLAYRSETAAFETSVLTMRQAPVRGLAAPAFDGIAFAGAFHITILEGVEVVFIVVAAGAGGPALLLPAGVGALAALALVAGLGVVLHRPLSAIPQNAMKTLVGVLLCAFGTFWAGEGRGAAWPGGDLALPALVAVYGVAVWVVVVALRGKGRGRG